MRGPEHLPGNFLSKTVRKAFAALHSIFEKQLSGKVVAGAGFEPTTFGL